jgi:transposase
VNNNRRCKVQLKSMNRTLVRAMSGANEDVADMAKRLCLDCLSETVWFITEIVPDCTKATLQRVIRGHIAPDTLIHSDGWRGYDGLVDIGFDKHFRVNHSANEFAKGEYHINGIESFWSYAKCRLQKFNGVAKHTFYLHLKETELRFNHRRDNLYLELLRFLRVNPL